LKVAVIGLWHLGSVVATCSAAAGHTVRGWDPDVKVVSKRSEAFPPVSEPGVASLARAGLDSGALRFELERRAAVFDADLVWITFDTPVDEDDRADVDGVIAQVVDLFGELSEGALVVVSSQLPVGSTARIERAWEAVAGPRHVTFASVPENLRLGRAVDAFTNPDRIVAGVRNERDRVRIAELFAPITNRIEWMSVESAEMTKHAINAFLATSVAFINELAELCETCGADAKDVERGLKSERRIGPSAYLSPGAAFAGGTLARDVMALKSLGATAGRKTALLDGVEASNREHRHWTERRLVEEVGSLSGKRIAVWGLTYKPGTDTLRRSMSTDLCRWLLEQGADVRVHDPEAEALPFELNRVERFDTALDAVRSSSVLVVATEWPEYRSVDPDELATALPSGLVIDANRFLGGVLARDSRFHLVSVGQARR
jgi:UDPglucose 6-dehydrogenase